MKVKVLLLPTIPICSALLCVLHLSVRLSFHVYSRTESWKVWNMWDCLTCHWQCLLNANGSKINVLAICEAQGEIQYNAMQYNTMARHVRRPQWIKCIEFTPTTAICCGRSLVIFRHWIAFMCWCAVKNLHTLTLFSQMKVCSRLKVH